MSDQGDDLYERLQDILCDIYGRDLSKPERVANISETVRRAWPTASEDSVLETAEKLYSVIFGDQDEEQKI